MWVLMAVKSLVSNEKLVEHASPEEAERVFTIHRPPIKAPLEQA